MEWTYLPGHEWARPRWVCGQRDTDTHTVQCIQSTVILTRFVPAKRHQAKLRHSHPRLSLSIPPLWTLSPLLPLLSHPRFSPSHTHICYPSREFVLFYLSPSSTTQSRGHHPFLVESAESLVFGASPPVDLIPRSTATSLSNLSPDPSPWLARLFEIIQILQLNGSPNLSLPA